nr:MFS transporter [Nakamurella flavida]
MAQAVSTPIFGKLADTFGRKPVMMVGIGLFLIGSILCGFAWSMPALIAFRAVQGLGAGAVQPMGLTIVGDIYTVAERAKVQGYLASVWGISSVVGPALGGVFSEYVSWRWIFFVNIPLCLIAGWMLLRHLHENVTRQRRTIDYTGAVLLTAGCSAVLLGLLEGGVAWAWTSPLGIGVPVGGVLLLAVFVAVERRAQDPILPLWILRRRVLVASTLTSLVVGAVVLGLTTYIPTFGQFVLGAGPLAAGFALATLTIGWPIAAALSGRLYLRVGFGWTAVIGAVIALVGTLLILSLDGSLWQIALGCFVVGAGLGLVASPSLVAAQSSVGWLQRGVVTGTNVFARSIGSAVGVAAFGAIANATLGASDDAGGRPPAALVAGASHQVFLAVAILAAVMVATVLLLPRGRSALQDEVVEQPTGQQSSTRRSGTQQSGEQRPTQQRPTEQPTTAVDLSADARR